MEWKMQDGRENCIMIRYFITPHFSVQDGNSKVVIRIYGSGSAANHYLKLCWILEIATIPEYCDPQKMDHGYISWYGLQLPLRNLDILNPVA